jgi:hypothetical protein
MSKRKLTKQEKQYAIDSKRAQIRDSGKGDIIRDLVVDDETDRRGQPIVRDRATGTAQ